MKILGTVKGSSSDVCSVTSLIVLIEVGIFCVIVQKKMYWNMGALVDICVMEIGSVAEDRLSRVDAV